MDKMESPKQYEYQCPECKAEATVQEFSEDVFDPEESSGHGELTSTHVVCTSCSWSQEYATYFDKTYGDFLAD